MNRDAATPHPDVPTMYAATVTAITAHDCERWVCTCGNTPHSSGFCMIDRNGDDTAHAPERWVEPLYKCDGCGHVIDAATYDDTTHTVAVVGRLPNPAH